MEIKIKEVQMPSGHNLSIGNYSVISPGELKKLRIKAKTRLRVDDHGNPLIETPAEKEERKKNIAMWWKDMGSHLQRCFLPLGLIGLVLLFIRGRQGARLHIAVPILLISLILIIIPEMRVHNHDRHRPVIWLWRLKSIGIAVTFLSACVLTATGRPILRTIVETAGAASVFLVVMTAILHEPFPKRNSYSRLLNDTPWRAVKRLDQLLRAREYGEATQYLANPCLARGYHQQWGWGELPRGYEKGGGLKSLAVLRPTDSSNVEHVAVFSFQTLRYHVEESESTYGDFPNEQTWHSPERWETREGCADRKILIKHQDGWFFEDLSHRPVMDLFINKLKQEDLFRPIDWWKP